MEEINFIRPEEVYNRNTGESKVRYRSYDGNDRFIPVVEGEDGVPKTLTKVTWQELKNKRDASKLTPGALYRITDYNCTTTQENTQSAGHQFDIVVLALSEDTLSEEAWAMPHDGDEYFQNSNLSAWKVWYCLDNDKSRFAWADDSMNGEPLSVIVSGTFSGMYSEDVKCKRNPLKDATFEGVHYFNFDGNRPGSSVNIYTETLDINSETKWYGLGFKGNIPASKEELNDVVVSSVIPSTETPNGRGVIYRLIDEYNNDIKYDFKNIQFVRKLTDGQYDADNGTNTWCYTLNVWYNDMCQDASIVGNTLPNDDSFVIGVYDNKFGYATAYNLNFDSGNTIAFALGNNVILSLDEGDGYFGINSNIIGNDFYNNTIGTKFNFNIIGNNFYSNIIRNSFHSNIIGNEFFFNKVGNNFYSNSIGNYFGGNTISDDTSYKNYGNNGVELATKS